MSISKPQAQDRVGAMWPIRRRTDKAETQIDQIKKLELALAKQQEESQKLHEECRQKDVAIQDLETALNNRRIIAQNAKKASKLHKDNLSRCRREVARLQKQVEGMDEAMFKLADQEFKELAERSGVGSGDGAVSRTVSDPGR